MQSIGIAWSLEHAGGGFVLHPGFRFVAMTTLTFTAGSAFIMWVGEQITERGIGNGMSLIIFVGYRGGPAARHRQHLPRTPSLRINGRSSR